MYGDIIYVDRQPLLWRSTEHRKNPDTRLVDIMIYRVSKYRHYGIDLGNGRVVHYIGSSFLLRQDSSIMEDSIEVFLKDGMLGVIDDIPYIYSRDEVVKRAKEELGSNFGGYSVVHNNCEHFALWCATGMKESRQSWLLKYGYDAMAYPKRQLKPLSRKVINVALVGTEISLSFLKNRF
jgi:hypothetical protein